jgi:hypothetical protein
MVCKHVYQVNLEYLLKSNGTKSAGQIKCRLKLMMKNDVNKKVNFNIALTRHGYVIPVTSDSCPLARKEVWHNCPFFELLR